MTTLRRASWPALLIGPALLVGALVAAPTPSPSALDVRPLAATGTDLVPTITVVTQPTAGAVAAYDVVVQNVGGSLSSGEITVSLSRAVDAVSGLGWTCVNVTCTTPATVSPGAGLPPLQVQAKADADLASPFLSAGMSAHLSGGGDLVTTDNDATVSPAVSASSAVDLAVGVTQTNLSGDARTADFAVEVANLGGATSGPVALRVATDLQGPGVLLTASGPGWACSAPPKTLACQAAAVPAGGRLTPLAVHVDPGTYPYDHVVLQADVQGAADALAKNDSARATAALSHVSGPDLALSASQSADAGTHRFVLANLGLEVAPGPQVIRLGSGDGAVTASGQGWTCAAERCTRAGDLAPGVSLPPVVVPVGSGTDRRGTVGAVLGDTPAPPASGTTSGVSVPPGTRLALTDVAPARAGSVATAQVVVSNATASALPGPFLVTPVVGTSTSSPFFVPAPSGPGWSCSGGQCSHPGPLPAGEALPALSLAKQLAPSDTTVEWTATSPDSSAEAAAQVGGRPVDLVAVVSDPGPLRDGQRLVRSLVVRNLGDGPASGPISASLPGAESGDGWTCLPGYACEHAGPLPAGGSLPPLVGDAGVVRLDQLGTYPIRWDAGVYAVEDDVTTNNAIDGTTALGGITQDLVPSIAPTGPYVAGTVVPVTVRVANLGSETSPGPVELFVQAPTAGTQVEGDGWACTDGLACTHEGPVSPGAHLPDLVLQIRVPPDVAPGGSPWLTSATVVSTAHELSTNDTASVTWPVVPVGGPAALQLALTATSTSVLRGGTAEVQLRALNRSSQDVAASTVTLTGTTGLTLEPGLGDGVLCTGLTCRVRALAPGETATLPVVARASATAEGQLFVQADGDVDLPTPGSTTTSLPLLVADRGADLVPLVTSEGLVPAGTRSSMRVRVTNVGTVPSTGRTTVDFGFPFRQIVSAQGDGWRCIPSRAQCLHDAAVPAGGSLPDLVAVPLDPFFGTTTPVTGTGVVVRNASDVDTADNGASVQAPRQQPGLSPRVVPVLASATPVLSGGSGRIGVRVRNPDPAAVTGPVTVTARAGSGSAAVDLSNSGGPGWTCGVETCTRPGPVAAGAELPELGLVVDVPIGAPSGSLGLTITSAVPGAPTGTTFGYGIGLPLVRDYFGAAARVSSFAPAADGSVTVVFDRDAFGLSSATAGLVDASGAIVASRLACAPGPCTGPVRGLRITPSTPPLPGTALRGVVSPPVTQTLRLSPAYRVNGLVQDRQATQAWATVADPRALGGRFAREKLVNASFTGGFAGTGVRYWYVAGPDHGLVRVLVDGRQVGVVDQYAPVRTARLSRAYGGLAPGNHRIQVVVAGTKRAASRGTFATVDGLSPIASTCPSGCEAVGAYAWRATTSPVATDRVVVAAAAPWSTLSLRFSGTGVDVRYLRAASAGSFVVYVDGRRIGTGSGRAAATSLARFRAAGLVSGTHTLQVVAAGNGVVAVDRLEVL